MTVTVVTIVYTLTLEMEFANPNAITQIVETMEEIVSAPSDVT